MVGKYVNDYDDNYDDKYSDIKFNTGEYGTYYNDTYGDTTFDTNPKWNLKSYWVNNNSCHCGGVADKSDADNPPPLPPESLPYIILISYIHSNIPNDGERILLFSLVYQMNLFNKRLFWLAHQATHQVVKNQVVRYDDLNGELGELGQVVSIDLGENIAWIRF